MRAMRIAAAAGKRQNIKTRATGAFPPGPSFETPASRLYRLCDGPDETRDLSLREGIEDPRLEIGVERAGRVEGGDDHHGQALLVDGSGKVERVCPQWFGARGDGEHNDTAAIQAAINSITAGVIPRNSRFVNATSRGLSND